MGAKRGRRTGCTSGGALLVLVRASLRRGQGREGERVRDLERAVQVESEELARAVGRQRVVRVLQDFDDDLGK